MVNLKEIFGFYKATEREENIEFWNLFTLEIKQENKQIRFAFVMITEGGFGKIGKDWYGRGFFRADHLALIIEKERDWIYTTEDGETDEYIREKNESLPIEIYTQSESVIVYHKYIDRYIELKKVTDEDKI